MQQKHLTNRQTSKINWELFILYWQHWRHLMLTSRILLKQTLITIMVTSIYVFFWLL